LQVIQILSDKQRYVPSAQSTVVNVEQFGKSFMYILKVALKRILVGLHKKYFLD